MLCVCCSPLQYQSPSHNADDDVQGAEEVSTGLLTYPVLMAADILLYQVSYPSSAHLGQLCSSQPCFAPVDLVTAKEIHGCLCCTRTPDVIIPCAVWPYILSPAPRWPGPALLHPDSALLEAETVTPAMLYKSSTQMLPH